MEVPNCAQYYMLQLLLKAYELAFLENGTRAEEGTQVTHLAAHDLPPVLPGAPRPLQRQSRQPAVDSAARIDLADFSPLSSCRSPQAALKFSCRSDSVTRDGPVALRVRAAQSETQFLLWTGRSRAARASQPRA